VFQEPSSSITVSGTQQNCIDQWEKGKEKKNKNRILETRRRLRQSKGGKNVLFPDIYIYYLEKHYSVTLVAFFWRSGSVKRLSMYEGC
jgi:hypothetical protein